MIVDLEIERYLRLVNNNYIDYAECVPFDCHVDMMCQSLKRDLSDTWMVIVVDVIIYRSLMIIAIACLIYGVFTWF